MVWEIVAAATAIISTIIAVLTYLHMIERSRPRPAGSQAASQGLSWPSVLASVAMLGVVGCVVRQILSSYLITIAGFKQRVPILTVFGVKVLGGGFIAKYLTVYIVLLLLAFGAAAFARRYGEASEDLPGVAFFVCLGSMLVTTIVLQEPLHNWWVANIAPFPE